jgi:CP family cyanate transporter-like MFS transporter
MLCFGLVNGGYSSLVAWLAPFYQTHGWSAAGSGSLVAVMTLSQAAAALLLPTLARRNLDRRTWLWLSLALQAVAFMGLVAWPDLYPKLWAAVGGAGLGGFFALFMVVALDHDHRPAHAAALSAVMQGGGFLLAALAPWLAAVLHDYTDGFTAGWLVHLGCIAVVAGLTARLSPAGYTDALACRENATPRGRSPELDASLP